MLCTACSDLTSSSDASTVITIPVYVTAGRSDGLFIFRTDVVNAVQSSPDFAAIQNKIIDVSILNPQLSVVSFVGSDTARIDTFCLGVTPSAIGIFDTLAGPPTVLSGVTLTSMNAFNPQTLWLKSAGAVRGGQFFTHAPHVMEYLLMMHLNCAVDTMVLRLDLPLSVAYLK